MLMRTVIPGLLLCTMPTNAAAEQPLLMQGPHRLQQVAVTTLDLDRAIGFYRDTLGLKLMFVTNNMAFFDLTGTRLMVALDKQRQQARAQTILYLDAPDFEAAVARLIASNVEKEGEVETVQSTQSGSLKLQQFKDPDGNALALMGFVPRG